MRCDWGVTPAEFMPQRASHFISRVPKGFSELELIKASMGMQALCVWKPQKEGQQKVWNYTTAPVSSPGGAFSCTAI